MLNVKQRGFTLLEIMIAVFILAIGLLGMAHLQVATLKATQSADFKTQATMLAADMVDRMRANSEGAYNGNYALDPEDDPPAADNLTVNTDLSEWRTNVSRYLPGGIGGVACPTFVVAQEFVCTITIQFIDIQTGDAAGVDYNERDVTTLRMDAAI